jgi:prepilin-type N-terminal cleavage/methylation domain-containing protein
MQMPILDTQHVLKNRLKSDSEGGFTLIELLVVIGILAILLAITLIAINPNKHFEDVRNTQRSSNVGAILDGIYEYESANNGNIPSDIAALPSNSPVEICKVAASPTTACPNTVGSTIDLCPDLVPTYLADLPYDPNSTYGNVTGGATPCATGTTSYDTGYTLTKTTSGRITISAPHAEDGVGTITVTR